MTVLLLCWAFLARMVLPLELIHENVDSFHHTILENLLGDLYDVIILSTRPCQFGFPFVTWPRCYCVLLLRGRVRVLAALYPPYEQVQRALEQFVPRAPLSTCFVASAAACLEEENKVRAKLNLDALTEGSADWAYLLTRQQAMQLTNYFDMWRRKYGEDAQTIDSCVFDLNQNPMYGRSSAKQGDLPTITTKSSRMWVPKRRRWLLPMELAIAHGHPVMAESARQARSPLDPYGGSYSVTQVGNCMHVATVGSVLAIVLGSVGCV